MLLGHDISKGNRTSDVKISQNITFETMLLAPNTMKGLKDSGFHKPSPIQLYGIPIGKCGFDLLLEAKSGTGKTAVFTIIALEKLDFCKGLQVVILTPTREIAAQICDVLQQIGSNYEELKVEVVMGGLPIQDDIKKFKKPVHVVVGSPGRLRHLIQNKTIDVKSVRLLVLDEADKLMDGSFQSDIKFIHTTLPKQKQVIMSSATYPQRSRDLINSYVQNASHVCPDSDCVLLGIDQKVSLVKFNNNIIRHTQDRFKELHKILGRIQFKQCLVFCNYQVRVAEVHQLLEKAEWPSQKLYGQQEQVDRLDALKTLQQYKCRILVSTDLAARGIDASNIDLVVNFEPPHEWQIYLHRIGRAGRFGSYGLAITILSEGKEQQKFKQMFESMELSINMRHLWSDEEFNINNLAPNTSTKQCDLPSEKSTTEEPEKLSCTNMCELLSRKSDAINYLETFESLYKSKDISIIPKIEKFSELMTSLEEKNYQKKKSDEKVDFKHIEMRKALTNIKVSQTHVTETDTVNKDLLKRIENVHFDVNENENELQTILSDSSKNINNNINNINTVTIRNNNDELHDISKTLLDLDLPITFSSSKFKTHDTNQKINKTIPENKTYRSNVNKNKDLGVNNIPTELQKNAKKLTFNDDTGVNPSSYTKKQIHNRNKVDNHYDTTKKCYEKECKCKKTNPQNQNYGSSQRIKYTFNSMELKDNAKLYTYWYNQLKMRMKHIEQAVYIDEMSKL